MMTGNVQLRKQMNEMLGNWQHSMQAASRQDVDEIMLSIRHLEQRLVDGLERVSSQLEALSARISRPSRREGDVRRRRSGARANGGSEQNGQHEEVRPEKATRFDHE